MNNLTQTIKEYGITKDQEDSLCSILNKLRKMDQRGIVIVSNDYESAAKKVLSQFNDVEARYAAEDYLMYLAKDEDRFTDVYVKLYDGLGKHTRFIADNNLR